MKPIKDVDAYIALAPKEVQDKLQEIRATIKAAAPAAQERMSYGLAYYHYKGRLAYFGYWKKHIGLYALPRNIASHARELKDYITTKGTIQLPLDKKLPLALIRKIIKAQVKKNDAADKKK